MNVNDFHLGYTHIVNADTELAGITLQMARFDQIHPIVSGNKLFKLHFFMDQLLRDGITHFVTTGGAYSNHLAAAAHFCNINKISCTGIIRGEESRSPSHTLKYCREMGMNLVFIERSVYDQLDGVIAGRLLGIPETDFSFIPSGGFHPLGAKGASLMFETVIKESPTHIVMAMGTGTTISGFLTANRSDVEIIGVSVLKGMNDWNERWQYLTMNGDYTIPTIWDDFHCGGYARYKNALIDQMNILFLANGIETDFVYTGKMMLAVFQQIRSNYFKPGSKVICIHTGGLQGNLSLPSGLLRF